MTTRERPITFDCDNSTLYGMLHPTEVAAARGVLIVVGGPQYRVGSHRQFVLLARDLAAHGIPVMRFDYRGMGDSDGPARTFEAIEADMSIAVDTFVEQSPGLREIVVWGLCDAASAAAFYAHRDPRLIGLVLLNPWVRTESGIAKAYLRHYYLTRVLSKDFWRKILRGNVNVIDSFKSLAGMIISAAGRSAPAKVEPSDKPDQAPGGSAESAPLPARVLDGLKQFEGRILCILSGDDFDANEFRALASQSRPWRRLMRSSRVSQRIIPEANHTFARRDWRDQVARWTREWVERL